jgi:methyl-accepting chemotaxis protein
MADCKLSVEVPSKYLNQNDEIGSLFKAFAIVAEHMNLIISDISFVLAEMSYKNLAIEIDREYFGDFQPIKQSIKNILESYNNLLYGYDAVSKQVSASSLHLSDISGELAQGSVKQSKTIDELSSTIQLVSNNANKNSQNTHMAKDYVYDMRNNIETSNEQMRQMLSAIDEISVSSSHISRIINVIDEIAFHTNILALNAAVEAARAGNAGKGFESFNDLKKYLESPGEGNQWHHIVEQSQINKSGFSVSQIQNTDNIIAIDKATHAKISGYYSSKQAFTGGKTVRDWLAGQSYEAQ